jgi:hypothetical protein
VAQKRNAIGLELAGREDCVAFGEDDNFWHIAKKYWFFY